MKETAPLWSSLFRYSKYWIVLEVERHQQVRTDIVRSEVETGSAIRVSDSRAGVKVSRET